VERRWLVALGAALAVACGIVATAKFARTPPRALWQVATQAQVDMPQPLIADTRSSSATIQAKTVLIADALTADDSQSEIARRAGISPQSLTVLTPEIDVQRRQGPLATAAQVTNLPQTPFAVTVIASTYSPLITLVASGPDERTAARLSHNAMEVLIGSGTGNSEFSMVVRELGAARTSLSMSSGPGMMLGVAAGVFFFGAWCVALALAAGLLKQWRGAARAHASATAG
jgi:hypothetical protein